MAQLKSKQNKESHVKGAKPSRLAANFNGKLTENNEVQKKHNHKPKATIKNFADSESAPTNETCGFVSKNDLTKLLKTLSEDNLKNVSAEQNEPQLGTKLSF